ncbi:MAG: GTPase [Rhodospirillales bacterium]|nr:GTPase [Rhodospirillales bacterium]
MTASTTPRTRLIILGAAGRDFHNFNMLYRDDPAVEVIAFTATQIPGIADRRYPRALAGALYPDGIRIADEADLEDLCRTHDVDRVEFAYSDVTHATVMHLAARALACGADFSLNGPGKTMLNASRPVIAVSAIRTGCGKSQTARWISERLRKQGHRVAALRHPMPYGDLAAQRVQRFATRADLDAADCTIEEREEYEPYVALGALIFAGVDYAEILAAAEREADVIIWDGGNNDFPFIRPDLHICITDALRPGQAAAYHPGETVLRMADVAIINKVDAAPPGNADAVAAEIASINPTASVIRAASPVRLDDPEAVRGRRVIIIEDGPTITHGGMAHGAGYTAAMAGDVAGIIDPRASAAPLIRDMYERFPHIGPVLPAMGYGPDQLEALRETIENAQADVVISATPIDLGALIKLSKPMIRARYEFAETEDPGLGGVIDRFVSDKLEGKLG